MVCVKLVEESLQQQQKTKLTQLWEKKKTKALMESLIFDKMPISDSIEKEKQKHMLIIFKVYG